ncbi:hypothetical protein N9J56_02140 [Pelagibacteraceae bacterium]|nr:hypothetical protein [Pelagibacteraceae bacterium]
MKLLNLNKKSFFSIILFTFFTPLLSEDSVDIWKKENLKTKINKPIKNKPEQFKSKININLKQPKEININSNSFDVTTSLVYGIFDPEENNLTLDMWVNSEGTRVKDTIERINKIKLSSFAEDIITNTLFTISKLPNKNMSDAEFIDYKFNWLIKNKRDDLIATFLNKNNEFPNKKIVIRYLVDKNIAKANLNEACRNITLISKDVKDSYLDQFKIICLIKYKKKEEAQLTLDLLREQKLSNKFFDKKIDYLLGLTEKLDDTIDDTNLLNFYLSSITIKDFAYTPNKKTNKKIWQYLVAANLFKVNNLENKEKIKELEIAANEGSLPTSYILEIYKKEKFNFNDFLNTDEVYPTLDVMSARALVYQKILLSNNIETKLNYIFLLNELFKKDKLLNLSKEYLNNELKALDQDKIPPTYEQLVAENIIYDKKIELKKIKYNNKKYHTSKILTFYTENNISREKVEKEIKNIHKKIKKNKKYKVSLKDTILFETLQADGIDIPTGLIDKNIIKNNLPPIELLNFGKNNETGMLLLRIAELIGEDEILNLDEQTIYFINHLLIKSGLKKISKKMLTTMLPERNEI